MILFLQFQFLGLRAAGSSLVSLKLLLKLMVESQIVVGFVVGDDLIGVNEFLLKFLVMGAALQGISGFDVAGHGFVELVGSK